MRTAKHDLNMTGLETEIDEYVLEVGKVFGKCKVNKHTFTNCGIWYTKLDNGDAQMDQDEYIGTLRPIVSSELTESPAEANATTSVSNQFVSLRGAMAYV